MTTSQIHCRDFSLLVIFVLIFKVVLHMKWILRRGIQAMLGSLYSSLCIFYLKFCLKAKIFLLSWQFLYVIYLEGYRWKHNGWMQKGSNSFFYSIALRAFFTFTT